MKEYTETTKQIAQKSTMALAKAVPDNIKPFLEETSFLNVINPTFTIRKYCVENNIHYIPECETCGNHTTVNAKDNKLGFNRFCSDACRKAMPKISKEAFANLENYDWLYKQRITLKKSKETIAEELGVSITPVNKWLKIHNIANVKYNQSNGNILMFLDNKDWLYEQYIINNKTCEEIASMIGSSKHTVSLRLHKFGIEITPPNAYDRPFTKISKGHQELLDFIQSNGIRCECNNRSLLNGLELDIVIPSLKVAIEYGSVYTHHYRSVEDSFSKRKDESYHITKYNMCKNIGYTLIHIWENDWYVKKKLMKSMIKHRLGITNNKIFARKCKIIEIDVSTKNLFLDNNHIQGKDKSLFKYGLLYNNALVSIMTIRKSTYNKEFDWEISRFCSIQNTLVIGAFTKLLNYIRNNHPGSYITYADKMHSTGNVYDKHMDYLYDSPVSYRYACKNTELTYHRRNFQKKKLLEMGMGTENLTEFEIMMDNGYVIIFDCGHKCYGIK